MAGETALRASVPALTGTPVVAARLAAAAVAAVLGTHAWRGRGSRGAVPLAALLFGVALWTGASALSTLAPGRAGTVFWYHTASVGAVTAVTAWALFVLEYASFEDLLGPRAYTALAVEPLVVLVFVFTNGSHGLFWSAYRFDAAAATVAPVPGPAFRAHVAYVYGMVLISWGVLFATLASRRRTLARGQVLTLGGAMVAPVLASTAWLPVRHPDPTPYGFLVAGGLLSVAVFRYRLSSVTPVARDAVVERMRAAVVVLDGDDRVVDRNAAAERLFGLFGDDVGRPAAEAFASVPAVAEWFREGADAAEIDLDPPAGDPRTVGAEVTPLAEAGDARLLTFHDVTDRKRRREFLRKQNDRLERFAAVAAHEFRNPLAIARGTVETAMDDPGAADLETAARALDRIDRIVDEVLDIAREGRAIVDTEPVTLVSAAENAWADVDARPATLGPVPAMLVVADRVRLQRLLANLFRNCIERATDPPATGADGSCPVTVRIGLSVVRIIARAHGWDLRIAGSRDGGTRFEIDGAEFVGDDEPAA